ncbi:MAG: siphovirus ReqiPepy6 Gp37-like family protein [Sphaerochaeta sp.]|jgi:hypothetical protein|nr:siphovirus ReqiPepy6 Gp37-like family protein [Sphaerochaeta sp.]
MSASVYGVVYKNPLGNSAINLEFSRLDYARRVNEVGVLEIDLIPFYLPGTFVKDGRIEIYRKPEGGDNGLHLETVWFVRKILYATNESGEDVLRLVAHDNIGLLARRVIAYDAGTAYTRKTDYADNIIKALVFENFSAGAIDANRDLSAYLTVDADRDSGAAMDIEISWQNVLDSLTKIAEASEYSAIKIIFDMITSDGLFVFKTWANYRGQDHGIDSSSPVTFSMYAGNMLSAEMEEDYDGEINYAYVIGEGALAEAVNQNSIDQSPFARVESAYNSQTTETETAQSEADAIIVAGKPKRRLKGKIVDTPLTRYGVHYEYGDRVIAEYRGFTFDCTLEAVHITYDGDNGETLELLLEGEQVLT